MPGKNVSTGSNDANVLCKRCQSNEASITIRTEPLCTSCFAKYVHTKVVKRMESFRVRHSEPGRERTLLLPLSRGVSSVTLLCVLSRHLETQRERTGRTGFGLCVVFVDDSGGDVDKGLLEEGHEGIPVLEGVRRRWPGHEYCTVGLEDVFEYEDVSGLLHDAATLSNRGSDDSPPATNSQKIRNLLASLPSPTSRADMLQILQRKLIVHIARQRNCEAILWGDSTTRLAERTLAETAKGRGFSLASQIADGASPYEIPMYYPMRDLLKKELVAHAGLVEPPLDEVVVEEESRPLVSMRDMTVDGLMRRYVDGVEGSYPGVVANVVRTTGKLRALDGEGRCGLCGMPTEEGERGLCHGCSRMVPQAAR